MAKIVITVEDEEGGATNITTTSDPPFPGGKIEDYTNAQTVALAIVQFVEDMGGKMIGIHGE